LSASKSYQRDKSNNEFIDITDSEDSLNKDESIEKSRHADKTFATKSTN
jgi:hypothetical protein